jgi:hypothetical protein
MKTCSPGPKSRPAWHTVRRLSSWKSVENYKWQGIKYTKHNRLLKRKATENLDGYLNVACSLLYVLYLSILVVAKVPQWNQSVDRWQLVLIISWDFFLWGDQVLSGHHRRNGPSVEWKEENKKMKKKTICIVVKMSNKKRRSQTETKSYHHKLCL